MFSFVCPRATLGGRGKLGGVEDPIRVVYVEDDERLGRLTSQYLQSEGVDVHLVTRGDRAVSEVLALRPDVVLLDLNLPHKDGLVVCRELRRHSALPVIISPRELLARIRAHARRARGKTGPRATRLSVGALVVDAGSLTATYDGKPITLTAHEFSLLRALAENAGSVLSREQLLQLTSGTAEDAFDRSVDVHVFRLRQKLGDDPKSPRLIKTIRGRGYVLMELPT